MNAPKVGHNSELRAIADRASRLLEGIEEQQADLKELKLEAKAKGFNVPELMRWVKAERKDKVADLQDNISDAALIGAALGHPVSGMSLNDEG